MSKSEMKRLNIMKGLPMNSRLTEIKKRLRGDSVGYDEIEWLIDRVEKLEKVRKAVQNLAAQDGIRGLEFLGYSEKVMETLKEAEE